MQQKTIDSLHPILKNNICSMKTASYDDKNKMFLSQSRIKVIHFDNIPNEYSKRKHLSMTPKSNDALYISGDDWYFIEFKNGQVKKEDIFRKIYDSLIMLIELKIIPDLDFSRSNICYILVCHTNDQGNAVQSSASRAKIANGVRCNAHQYKMLYDTHKFKEYLFHEVRTCDPDEFQRYFIDVMERAENSEDAKDTVDIP